MNQLKQALLKSKEKFECIKKEEWEDDGFIKGKNYRCTLKNGEVIYRNKIVKNNSDGSSAIIIPVTDDNELILVIQPRVFTDDTVEISFPGGLVDEDETDMSACAKRELLEETGVEATNIEKVGSVYENSANSSGKQYFFIARGCKITKEQDLDDDEFIDIVTVPISEAFEFLKEDRTFPTSFLVGMNYLKEKI